MVRFVLVMRCVAAPLARLHGVCVAVVVSAPMKEYDLEWSTGTSIPFGTSQPPTKKRMGHYVFNVQDRPLYAVIVDDHQRNEASRGSSHSRNKEKKLNKNG